MADASAPRDPELEITPQRAAEILEITPAHVLELTRNGILGSRDGGDGLWVRASDVEAFGAQRRRQLAAAQEIADVVNRSPGGWDS
jgi:hypothetical protein